MGAGNNLIGYFVFVDGSYEGNRIDVAGSDGITPLTIDGEGLDPIGGIFPVRYRRIKGEFDLTTSSGTITDTFALDYMPPPGESS